MEIIPVTRQAYYINMPIPFINLTA